MSPRLPFRSKRAVKGRIGGVKRKRHRTLQVGRLALQEIQLPVAYSMHTSLTRFGSTSIKIWLVQASLKLINLRLQKYWKKTGIKTPVGFESPQTYIHRLDSIIGNA